MEGEIHRENNFTNLKWFSKRPVDGRFLSSYLILFPNSLPSVHYWLSDAVFFFHIFQQIVVRQIQIC